jgi:hypothetical protein
MTVGRDVTQTCAVASGVFWIQLRADRLDASWSRVARHHSLVVVVVLRTLPCGYFLLLLLLLLHSQYNPQAIRIYISKSLKKITDFKC